MSQNLYKKYRISDLITKYSINELLIFLPIAKKDGIETIINKAKELIKSYSGFKEKDDLFYFSKFFFDPLSDGEPDVFYDEHGSIRLDIENLVNFLEANKTLVI